MFNATDDAGSAKLLKEQLQLVKASQHDGVAARYQIRPLQRKLGFDKGFYVCMRALQLLLQHNEGCIIVGVAGASGSGKTTFTHRLKKMLNNVVVLSMDMYNDGDKVLEDNFDDPRIADYDTLLQNIDSLKAGRSARVPIYDFKQSKRVGYSDVDVPESRVIIIEGIYALSQRLAPLLDLRISIEGGIHFDLVKRVMRDIERSGQGAGEVIQQVSDTVYPMYKAFIEPDLQKAHIKIANNFNPFAGFKEPIQILKTEDSVSVESVRAALADMFPGCHITQEAEVEVHDIFLLPPGEDPQGCSSWLRMRNKEGKYSLMFAEYVVSDPFIVSPRVSFEVPVRILGGLMALGYTIGSIMSRTSYRVCCQDVRVKWDTIEKLGCFVQVQGEKRDSCMRLADKVGITSFLPRSYIEQVQLLHLTEHFAELTDKARAHFSVGDEIIDDHVIGASPARKLAFKPRGNGLLRHSMSGVNPDAVPREVPLMTQLGWKKGGGAGDGAADRPRMAGSDARPIGAAPADAGARAGRDSGSGERASSGRAPVSQLSREIEALGLQSRDRRAERDGCGETSSVKGDLLRHNGRARRMSVDAARHCSEESLMRTAVGASASAAPSVPAPGAGEGSSGLLVDLETPLSEALQPLVQQAASIAADISALRSSAQWRSTAATLTAGFAAGVASALIGFLVVSHRR